MVFVPYNGGLVPQTYYTTVVWYHKRTIQRWFGTTNVLYNGGLVPQTYYTTVVWYHKRTIQRWFGTTNVLYNGGLVPQTYYTTVVWYHKRTIQRWFGTTNVEWGTTRRYSPQKAITPAAASASSTLQSACSTASGCGSGCSSHEHASNVAHHTAASHAGFVLWCVRVILLQFSVPDGNECTSSSKYTVQPAV